MNSSSFKKNKCLTAFGLSVLINSLLFASALKLFTVQQSQFNYTIAVELENDNKPVKAAANQQPVKKPTALPKPVIEKAKPQKFIPVPVKNIVRKPIPKAAISKSAPAHKQIPTKPAAAYKPGGMNTSSPAAALSRPHIPVRRHGQSSGGGGGGGTTATGPGSYVGFGYGGGVGSGGGTGGGIGTGAGTGVGPGSGSGSGSGTGSGTGLSPKAGSSSGNTGTSAAAPPKAAPAPPPPAPVTPPPPKEEPKPKGETKGPRMIRQTKPAYPSDAKDDGVEGTVVMLITVGKNGKISQAKVVDSAGDRRLDRAAEQTVKKWEYEPALRDGVPVESTIRVRVQFNIE